MADENLEELQRQRESVPICQFFPMGFSPDHRAEAGKVTEGSKEIPKFHGDFTESTAELTKGLGAERGQRDLWNNKKWARVQRKLFGELKTVLSSPEISQDFYCCLNPKPCLRKNSNWIFKLFGTRGILKFTQTVTSPRTHFDHRLQEGAYSSMGVNIISSVSTTLCLLYQYLEYKIKDMQRSTKM